ncbi:MAG: ABC transporter substrate-binding protein [Alphaproteobacteria bacterium]|nr:ABC transporter substrate-binding protein [Alphaproteobacteria bacterium]
MRVVFLALLITSLATGTRSAETITFGTDWRAQAEHGGFYQALAKGFYAERGLNVQIRQGGPQINHAQLLAAGKVEFSLSSNSFIALNYVRENIPMVAVAAIFQKDPSVLIAHPGRGNDSFAALKDKPIYIGADTRIGWWLFLKNKFGYSDKQIKSYTFSISPFLVSRSVIQQGYLGSEPFLIEKQGIKPVVMLIADAGYQGYGALIQTSRKLTETKPKIVRAFVEASIRGWQDYLTGNPMAGNNLIKTHNPEMTDALLAYGRTKMNEHGIVSSGDAKTRSIGAMTEKRWQQFHSEMSKHGVYPEKMDWRKGFTTKFLPTGPKPAK